MQTTSRKTNEVRIKKDKKEDSKKNQDEKPKKSVYSVSTPREYVSKTSASDIYAQKKNVTKAPKKVPGISTTSSVSPMRGLLKSSASSISQISRTSDRTPPKKLEAKYSTKDTNTTQKKETRKQELFTNVTVNSPVVKRKLDLNSERTKEVMKKVSKEVGREPRRSKEVKAKEADGVSRAKEVSQSEKQTKERGERQRTKTRTLEDSEVKILTPDNVDNNLEMQNLSKKLVAKPKAFYVDLDEDKPKSLPKKESSDEEVSYEDDFESYESDFDSYHSDASEAKSDSNGSEASRNDSKASEDAESEREASAESSVKERDEERMLDSGNFDLRDRSAKAKTDIMAFILEDTESQEDNKYPEDKKSIEDSKKSLDEGFQDMGSSASSIRTVDILDRPLFIDFTKSKQNKIKRAFNERLKQRAKDLLGMITLHKMTYSLFEMQPIAYDLYMATFGRNNYTQSGVQTFDDGITEETQTDDVSVNQKWTQYPVEFSKSDICGNEDVLARKYRRNTEDYLTKFTFLVNEKYDDQNDGRIKTDESYKVNPLRIFFEQKDGVGGDEMLPYETYKSKLKNTEYNPKRLSRFMKKFESKISSILTKNIGGKDLKGLEKSGKLPFSKGHVTISPKCIENPKFSFLRGSKISKIFFSETKSNLLMSVHKKVKGFDDIKSLVCLWDSSVAREPIKVLLAIDDIAVGRFRGSTDGIFVAALNDGSIHLWDLNEEPAWRDSVASDKKSPEIVGVEEKLTQTENDREWNLRNSKVGLQQINIQNFSPHLAIVYSSEGAKICYRSQISKCASQSSPKESNDGLNSVCIDIALQSCAYTNSAVNMDGENSDCVVGLEILLNQIVSLQRNGVLTIWSIIHEKKPSKDIGKAFWSKMKLEKHQSINLSQLLDTTIKENRNFNLNSAKRRLAQRKHEKGLIKKESSRPKTSNFNFDTDRPYSAASLRKKVLPIEVNSPKSWESGIVCNDLKIVGLNSVYSFLVAKNCGEVICCKRCLGVVRLERFSVATETSSITSLEVSKELPYFLAASDSGTVSLCSMLDTRVLLKLDCRNIPIPLSSTDKCQSDHKGRFVSSVAKSTNISDGTLNKLDIQSVHWSSNHCCIFVLLRNRTLLLFDLTHSDITAKFVNDSAAIYAAMAEHTLALISEDDLRIHRLTNEVDVDSLHLFNKYVLLL